MDEKEISLGQFAPELYKDKLCELFESRAYRDIRALTESIPAPDMAELFDYFDEREQLILFRLLPKENASECFVLMDTDLRRRLIDSFSDSEFSSIISELYIDDTVDLIEEMPANVVKRILRASTPEDRASINALLNYPKDSAGSLMTTEYVRLRKDMTVGDALTHIRRVALDKETIYTCYVTDSDRRLIGIVTAKSLMISDTDTPISDLMNENFVSVRTKDDREDVAACFERYGFLAVPVVDGEGRLVGIITFDDALTVIKEESEEDFAKMAAITPAESEYLKTSVWTLFRSRIPWLLILMLSATVSSTILTGFEAALPAVLVLFVPMIMGTGGNSGGQSSVTVIRGISRGEIRFPDIFRVFSKELLVGLLCALTLGAATFIKVELVERLLLGNSEVTLIVALTVSLALALTIIIAKMIGAILPLLAEKIGLDPAVMASPLITTLVDAVSLIVYFAVSKALIGA